MEMGLIRANPGKLTAATTAHGSFPHLALEMLRQKGKLDFVIVKHIGGAAAGTAVAGEHADFVIETAAVLQPFITAGKLVPLASTNTARSPQSPDLPTVAESGIEGFAISGWIGVVAPKGTPLELREAMQRAIVKALADETMRDRLSDLHFSGVASTPQEFETVITRERAQVGEIIRSGGLAEK
jgi:tripartite-type tricarboxylate transporter receptor subunit TctC